MNIPRIDWAEVDKQLWAGVKIKVVAKNMDAHPVTIRQRARKLGIPLEREFIDWPKYQHLLESQLKNKEVAEIVGCSIASISTKRQRMSEIGCYGLPPQKDYLGWMTAMKEKYGEDIRDLLAGEVIEDYNKLRGLPYIKMGMTKGTP